VFARRVRGRTSVEESHPRDDGCGGCGGGSGDPWGSVGIRKCAVRWTTRSRRQWAREVTDEGVEVSHPVVARMVAGRGCSVPAARTIDEGPSHPDRDAQFR
jgi:Rhodopirellula transposase DDE domain